MRGEPKVIGPGDLARRRDGPGERRAAPRRPSVGDLERRAAAASAALLAAAGALAFALAFVAGRMLAT